MDWKFLPRSNKGQINKSSRAATQKTDYGLHTVVDKAAEAAECIDVVAIHGLNGHFLRTWTDEETDINWLAEFIPRIMPASRVMSFSYNSTLQFSKSTSDLFVFADQLLENVLAKRGSLEEQGRPLIFICHSLGGLVFKQAFLKAFEDDNYMLLRKSMSSVLFFGTPHNGSSLAQWGTMTARLLRTASFGTSTNVRLSKDLEPDSRMMALISESFRLKCRNLKVVSCYETQKLNFLNSLRQVVEKNSAVLGFAFETVIPVESDHRAMCRFSDFNEGRFLPIKSRLDTLARDATNSNFIRTEDALMSRLNTSNYESHKTRNPPPVKGTCTWIFNHAKYQSWLKRSGSSLLWISADPGCGKSVLASFLVDDYMTSPEYEGTNVCYFFFKSDNADQSDVLNGVRAILHQLYTQQPGLISFGAPELRGHSPENVDKLWAAFSASVQHAAARPTICVLDGIDECEPGPRGLLLRCISGHFASQDRSPETQNPSNLRVLITSRPENQIKVLLDRRPRPISSRVPGAPSETYDTIRLRGEDETGAISHDVSKVIKARIDDLIDRGFPVALLENLQLELIKRADRTFLWVSLVLGLLEEKVEGGASRRELDDILRTRDIYNIYAELLASRPDLPKARKMLNLILAAVKPLTVKEVSIALAVVPQSEQSSQQQRLPRKAKRPGKLTFDDVEYELVYPFENHLKHICGHFIRIIKDRVYLVHETAREFLLGPKDPRHVAEQYHLLSPSSSLLSGPEATFQHTFSLLEAHALLLDVCVAFLYCLARQSKTSQPGEASEDTKDFLQYAAQSWTIHHHRARKQLDSLDSRYYQNLCHPLFPGFDCWMDQFWAPERPPHPGSAPDDVQDYYIDLFNLESPSPPMCDAEDQGDDDESSGEGSSSDEPTTVGTGLEETEKQKSRGISFHGADRLELRLPAWEGAAGWLSSNPGSLRNHYFPLRVDDGGMVALNTRRGSGKDPPKYQQ
ncbi:hypothetical protein LZ30DRAFT_576096 [Colletotrichum cereale]|nr:hypothetical protein LZ30DRAFT_576096 [Colletotrichum cereale]